jgi:hypothetical protein
VLAEIFNQSGHACLWQWSTIYYRVFSNYFSGWQNIVDGKEKDRLAPRHNIRTTICMLFYYTQIYCFTAHEGVNFRVRFGTTWSNIAQSRGLEQQPLFATKEKVSIQGWHRALTQAQNLYKLGAKYIDILII